MAISMNILESRWYWLVRTLANFFLLNLLWLLMCIPVLTIFPATAAMFGVVREWTRDRDATFYISFFRHLKETFFQSLGIGLLWLMLGSMLLFNLTFITQLASGIRFPLLLLIVLWIFVYVSASLYLFPIMVSYRIGWWDTVKNAIVISISQFGITALALLVVAIALLLCFYVPMTILLSGSLTAHLVYSLCNRAFQRVEGIRKLL